MKPGFGLSKWMKREFVGAAAQNEWSQKAG